MSKDVERKYTLEEAADIFLVFSEERWVASSFDYASSFLNDVLNDIEYYREELRKYEPVQEDEQAEGDVTT